MGSGARRRAAGCRGTWPGFSSGLCTVCQTEERPLHFSLSREQPGCISCSASVLCPGGSALPGTAVKGCTPGTINISELSPPATAPASRSLRCSAEPQEEAAKPTSLVESHIPVDPPHTGHVIVTADALRGGG